MEADDGLDEVGFWDCIFWADEMCFSQEEDDTSSGSCLRRLASPIVSPCLGDTGIEELWVVASMIMVGRLATKEE